MSNRRMVFLSAAMIPFATVSAFAAWRSPSDSTNGNQPSRLARRDAKSFFGKYRGTVANNIDPQQLGRITAVVSSVLGTTPSTWALPCCQGAGPNTGVLAIPQLGANVWVEFEEGDPDKPIWSGGFWSKASDLPSPSSGSGFPIQPIVMETPGQHSVTISDVPGSAGGIVIKSPTGASIVVNDTGIYVQNGKGAEITLIGPAVTINNKKVFL